MHLKKSLFLFGTMTIFCLAFWAQSSSTQKIADGKTKATTLNQLAGNSLNGFWKFNTAESDRAPEKVRNLFAQQQNELLNGSPQLTANQAEMSVLSVLLFPPETLILAGDKKEMTINENFKDIVQTRTVSIDGKIRPQKQNSGIKLFVTASGENNRLIIETASAGGSRLTETYELSPDAGGLKITVRMVDSEGREMLSLRRVYERTTLDIFSGESM